MEKLNIELEKLAKETEEKEFKKYISFYFLRKAQENALKQKKKEKRTKMKEKNERMEEIPINIQRRIANTPDIFKKNQLLFYTYNNNDSDNDMVVLKHKGKFLINKRTFHEIKYQKRKFYFQYQKILKLKKCLNNNK